MSQMLSHAGTVVFRDRDGEIEYLVVTSSDGLNWVLPKGHIDPGEMPEATALRELAEEAGVSGTMIAPLSVQHYERRGKDVAIQYFLVRQSGSTSTKEERTLRWETYDAALQLLSFPEARAALKEAVALMSDKLSG
ncbi:MAG TPA: NUDIX domain-containing protein [Pyrinomonadaceae bacterium]|jgi:8-oxo-dGTP pyrophosphatase MutT (NUDIX family)